MYVKNETFDNNPEILTNDHYVTTTITVSDTGITADELNRKIVPAGSLLNADGVIGNDATVVGVLIDDVDVTNGPQPGAIIIHGFINTNNLPVAPASTVSIPMVKFI